MNFNPYGKRVRTLAEVTAAASAPAGTINPLAPLMKVHTERQSTSDIGTVQQPSVDRTGGLSLVLKYKVAPNLELRSITAGRGVATNQWDNSGVESRNVFAPNTNFGRYSLSDLYQSQFSQEFQAVGDLGSSLTYVGGLYYFKEHVKESAATPFSNVWNADGSAFTIRSSYGTSAASAATAGWEYGTRFITRASHADAESYAVYGQGVYTPAPLDKLHLTLGGRFTNDKRNGLLYVVNAKATNFAFTYNKSRFDPLANIAYDLTDTVNVYAKYSTGYRAGGANDRSQTFIPFNAEEVKSYEIGMKGDFLDHSLRINLAAYAMDRTNSQIDFDNVDTTPGSPTQGAHTEETRNAAGVSQIRGFEADVTGRVSDAVTLGVSYAYTSVKIPSAPFPFPGNAAVPLGTPFPVHVVYTPPNAASAFIDYRVPVRSMTFRAHLDANYADPQYAFQRRVRRRVADRVADPERGGEDGLELRRQRQRGPRQHQHGRVDRDPVPVEPQPAGRDAHLPHLGGQPRHHRRLRQLQPAAHLRHRTEPRVLAADVAPVGCLTGPIRFARVGPLSFPAPIAAPILARFRFVL
ncbi:MAG: TonB-dependent receptor [Caulobacteraceae bacterium]